MTRVIPSAIAMFLLFPLTATAQMSPDEAKAHLEKSEAEQLQSVILKGEVPGSSSGRPLNLSSLDDVTLRALVANLSAQLIELKERMEAQDALITKLQLALESANGAKPAPTNSTKEANAINEADSDSVPLPTDARWVRYDGVVTKAFMAGPFERKVERKAILAYLQTLDAKDGPTDIDPQKLALRPVDVTDGWFVGVPSYHRVYYVIYLRSPIDQQATVVVDRPHLNTQPVLFLNDEVCMLKGEVGLMKGVNRFVLEIGVSNGVGRAQIKITGRGLYQAVPR